MTEENREKNAESSRSAQSNDSEEALQRELSRESAEGQGEIGDVRENRNLTGSSSWDTLADTYNSRNEERGETY